MNTQDIRQLKKHMRIEMLHRRNQMDVTMKSEYDIKICNHLIELVRTNTFSNIHCYLPINGEINIRPLIHDLLSENKTVIVPKTLPKRQLENRVLKSLNISDIEIGIQNTQHPANKEIFQGHYDLIVVPGLAFDEQNYRLGYGGGYYDSFLANQKEALKIGVFYPFQKVDLIPIESHDLSLDQILYFE